MAVSCCDSSGVSHWNSSRNSAASTISAMAWFWRVVRLPLAGSGEGTQALLQVGQVHASCTAPLTHTAQRNTLLFDSYWRLFDKR